MVCGFRMRLPVPLAPAVVLFDIVNLRVFADVEGMDAVMLGVAVAAVVDAAPGHDGHVRTLADKEVVIDHVVEPGSAQYDRDMHVSLLVKAGAILMSMPSFVGLGRRSDMLGVLAERLLSVETDVHRAVRDARHIRDGLENAF